MKIYPIYSPKFKSTYFTHKQDANSNPAEKDKSSLNQKLQNNNKYIIAGAGIASIATALIFRKSIIKIFSGNSINKTDSVSPIQEIIKPKHLYHLTSLENYESMLRDGKIKKSSLRIGDGVFFSDMNDLKNKYPAYNLTTMIKWYGGKALAIGGPKSSSNTVVLLKFPIKEESQNLLKWRQIKLPLQDNILISDKWNKFEDFCSDELKNLHEKPLEYLYQQEIPINEVKKCVEININELPEDNFLSKFWEKVNNT